MADPMDPHPPLLIILPPLSILTPLLFMVSITMSTMTETDMNIKLSINKRNVMGTKLTANIPYN